MKFTKEKLFIGVLLVAIGIGMSGCNKNFSGFKDDEIKLESIDKNSSESKEEPLTVNPQIEDGTIFLDDENFMSKLDEIFINIDSYIGRDIKYEGFVYKLEDITEDVYVVGRYYDVEHGDHSHETVVGLASLYEGQWPELNTWVEVSGVLEKNSINGESMPTLRVNELVTKEVRGQERIFD